MTVLADLKLRETINFLGAGVYPSGSGLGDTNSFTTALKDSIGRFDPSAPTLFGRSFDSVSLNDSAVGVTNPQLFIGLGAGIPSPPTLPLSTYSAELIWTPSGNTIGDTAVMFFSSQHGSTAGANFSWGLYNNGTGLLAFIGGGAISGGNIYTGGPYLIQAQVNNALTPKVTVRVYNMNNGAQLGSGTHNPTTTNAACLYFGDTQNSGFQTAHRYGNIRVWDTYNADGLWGGASPANTTQATSGDPGRYTLPANFRASTYTGPTPTPSFTQYNSLQYGTSNLTNNSRFISLWIPNGRPNNVNGFPCVMWVHGGFFVQGARGDLPLGFLRDCLSAGYAVASVGYVRSTLTNGAYSAYGTSDALSENLSGYGRYPTHYQDVKLAAVRLRDRYSQSGTLPQRNAQNWGIDPNLLLVGGFSAGGNIALGAALSRGVNNDGTGTTRDLTLAGSSVINANIRLDETNTAWTGADPAFIGCYGYAAPVDMTVAMNFDKTDPQSTNPTNCYLVPAVNRQGGSTARGLVVSGTQSYMGLTNSATTPSTTNTGLDNMVARNVAIQGNTNFIPRCYYVRGTADYLVHWEHAPLLQTAYTNAGVASRFQLGTNPGFHDNVNVNYDWNEFRTWADAAVVAAGGTPGIILSTRNRNPTYSDVPSFPDT